MIGKELTPIAFFNAKDVDENTFYDKVEYIWSHQEMFNRQNCIVPNHVSKGNFWILYYKAETTLKEERYFQRIVKQLLEDAENAIV